MNDAQLLERLARTDPYPADSTLPPGWWPPEVAYAEAERRLGPHPMPQLRFERRSARIGWAVVAGAFVAVLLAFVVLLAAVGDHGPEPVATTIPEPPLTTLAPPSTLPTTPPEAKDPAGLDPQTAALLTELERAYNEGDTQTATRLLTGDAVVSLAPGIGPGTSPSSASLSERIRTARPFDEEIEIDVDQCVRRGGLVECQVEVEDRFATVLDLDPWLQTWTVTTEGSQISSLLASGAHRERANAMDDFSQWVAGRTPEAPFVLAGSQEWVRTPDVAAVLDVHLVEYGALTSGIPQSAWELVSGLFAALSAADFEAAEGAFAPGARYSETTSNLRSTELAPTSELVGSSELREYWTWWYDMLQMEWTVSACRGDAEAIRCSAELRGVGVLFFPGGVSRGLVDFTLGPDGIVLVEDRVLLSADGGPDFRGFWRDDWIPEHAPEIEVLWPKGNGDPPDGFSVEFARAILEFYPRYLQDIGMSVPPGYLDGSLLAELAP